MDVPRENKSPFLCCSHPPPLFHVSSADSLISLPSGELAVLVISFSPQSMQTCYLRDSGRSVLTGKCSESALEKCYCTLCGSFNRTCAEMFWAVALRTRGTFINFVPQRLFSYGSQLIAAQNLRFRFCSTCVKWLVASFSQVGLLCVFWNNVPRPKEARALGPSRDAGLSKAVSHISKQWAFGINRLVCPSICFWLIKLDPRVTR